LPIKCRYKVSSRKGLPSWNEVSIKFNQFVDDFTVCEIGAQKQIKDILRLCQIVTVRKRGNLMTKIVLKIISWKFNFPSNFNISTFPIYIFSITLRPTLKSYEFFVCFINISLALILDWILSKHMHANCVTQCEALAVARMSFRHTFTSLHMSHKLIIYMCIFLMCTTAILITIFFFLIFNCFFNCQKLSFQQLETIIIYFCNL
jgi:hypothetical protein